MSNKKKIIFITGSRADYGKLKSIILKIQKSKKFQTFIFVTGMHNLKKYGFTWDEIKKDKIKNITRFNNQKNNESKMDIILSNTIKGFSNYAKKIKPDLVVVHGDRIEPLACAIVGCLNNYKVAHIEGGELSGTVDEILRHSISKLSHLHFVTNNIAKNRLIQMGENKKNVFIIGSPDIDILISSNLPNIIKVKKRYNIEYKNYAICIFHPVTTEIVNLKKEINTLINSMIESKLNYIIILPNNDTGSELIVKKYKKIRNNKNFRIIPSMRFEYYLTLLKNSDFIIGNSSSGVIEAPYYNIPSINIGSRQTNRVKKSINMKDKNINNKNILKHIKKSLTEKMKIKNYLHFGNGNSALNFIKILNNKEIWKISSQKSFVEIKKK